ncbi:MAG TPA: type II secretion system protein GspC [Gammaproteobacteria bacterium]|nr:type II secretion system protein GspC [Gammaproteobacteria bacterium]
MQTIASMQQVDFVRLMQSEQMRRVILVVNVLLVIWIASQLARLTWGFFASPEEAAPAVVATVATPVQRNEELELIRQVPGWHLMGVVSQQAAPVREAVPIEAPDTRLKLVLRGALSSDDPAHARAIIADPRGKEDQYAIGDNLPGNAELSEVHPDRVILKRNGRYETLRLPQDQRQKSPTISAVNSSPRPSVQPPARANLAQRLQNIKQRVQKNPVSLYEVVRPVPKQDEDGNIVGYTLQPGRDRELFDNLGLQAGDVVVQINDLKLDNAANSAQALKSVQNGQEVTMTVLRDGQEQVMSFSLPE